MHPYSISRRAAWLCTAALMLLAGCASSGHSYFSPAPDFDPGSYVNPADFGHPLQLGTEPADTADANPDFRPIEFEGGLNRLQERVSYPENHVPSQRSGEVVLQVYVDTTHSITNIREISSPAYFLTEAAVEVVRESVPSHARWRGVAVNSFILVPLQYELHGVEVRRQTGNE